MLHPGKTLIEDGLRHEEKTDVRCGKRGMCKRSVLLITNSSSLPHTQTIKSTQKL